MSAARKTADKAKDASSTTQQHRDKGQMKVKQQCRAAASAATKSRKANRTSKHTAVVRLLVRYHPGEESTRRHAPPTESTNTFKKMCCITAAHVERAPHEEVVS